MLKIVRFYWASCRVIYVQYGLLWQIYQSKRNLHELLKTPMWYPFLRRRWKRKTQRSVSFWGITEGVKTVFCRTHLGSVSIYWHIAIPYTLLITSSIVLLYLLLIGLDQCLWSVTYSGITEGQTIYQKKTAPWHWKEIHNENILQERVQVVSKIWPIFHWILQILMWTQKVHICSILLTKKKGKCQDCKKKFSTNSFSFL